MTHKGWRVVKPQLNQVMCGEGVVHLTSLERRTDIGLQLGKACYGHSDSRSVQENFNLIKSFIQEAVDKYIPSKTSRSVASVPWITSEIRRNIRKRNKTRAKAKKTGSSKLRSKFQELRQQIKADIKKQHDLYVNKVVGYIKVNPKDFYLYTNSQRKDNQGIPPLKRRNGSGLAESKTEQAEEFSGQFTDVFSKTSENEVPLLEKTSPPMSDIHILNEGVIKMLKGLNPSKALKPDEFYTRVLKELGPVFANLFQQNSW